MQATVLSPPIKSGFRPETWTDEVRRTIVYLENVRAELYRCREYQTYLSNPTVSWVRAEYHKIEVGALALIKQIDEKLARYRGHRGQDSVQISDPNKILDLLPSHRITAGPNRRGHGYSWRVVFKHTLFPAITALRDHDEYAFRRNCWPESDIPVTDAQKETVALSDRFVPLRSAGFRVTILPDSVKKSGVIFSLTVSTATY